jgi:DNA-damage-inducible protein J
MTSVHATIDISTKRQALAVLERKGITMSDAIRLFLRQVSKEADLPFLVEIPNAETRSAIREAEQGTDLESVTLEQLAAQWNESASPKKNKRKRKT